jgi:hypothetical protein
MIPEMSTSNMSDSAPKGNFKPTNNSTRQEIVSASQRLPIPDRPEWTDPKGIHRMFGIGKSTLYRLIEEGKVKSTSLRERGKLRGKRLVSTCSVAALLESRATGGDAPTA